jgi:hypothetical protein
MPPLSKNRCGSPICLSLLFIPLIWAFLVTIDAPTMKLGVDAGSIVYKLPTTLDRVNVAQSESLWTGRFAEEPKLVPLAFLLFDFKQNLRRWPNVASDITRSPPVYSL